MNPGSSWRGIEAQGSGAAAFLFAENTVLLPSYLQIRR